MELDYIEKIRPLGNRVILRMLSKEEIANRGGKMIVEAQERFPKFLAAEVKATGPTACEVSPGDRVLISARLIDQEPKAQYILASEEDLVAVDEEPS